MKPEQRAAAVRKVQHLTAGSSEIKAIDPRKAKRAMRIVFAGFLAGGVDCSSSRVRRVMRNGTKSIAA